MPRRSSLLQTPYFWMSSHVVPNSKTAAPHFWHGRPTLSVVCASCHFAVSREETLHQMDRPRCGCHASCRTILFRREHRPDLCRTLQTRPRTAGVEIFPRSRMFRCQIHAMGRMWVTIRHLPVAIRRTRLELAHAHLCLVYSAGVNPEPGVRNPRIAKARGIRETEVDNGHGDE